MLEDLEGMTEEDLKLMGERGRRAAEAGDNMRNQLLRNKGYLDRVLACPQSGLILFATSDSRLLYKAVLKDLLAQANHFHPKLETKFSLTGKGVILGRRFLVMSYALESSYQMIRGTRYSLAFVYDGSASFGYLDFMRELECRMYSPNQIVYIQPHFAAEVPVQNG